MPTNTYMALLQFERGLIVRLGALLMQVMVNNPGNRVESALKIHTSFTHHSRDGEVPAMKNAAENT